MTMGARTETAPEPMRAATAFRPAGSEGRNGSRSVWMCSGQGSQFFQMGRDAFENDPVFRRAMEASSAIAQKWIGISLAETIYEPRRDRFHPPFDRLLHTNPALVCLQTSVAKTLEERAIRPDLVVGYSIGELSAAVIAGLVPLEQAIRVSIVLAEIVEAHLPAGGMLAILEDPSIRKRNPEAFEGTRIAACNFATHFVVAGDAEAIARTESDLSARKIAVQRLPVRFAFHSRTMEPIRDRFLDGVSPLIGRDLAEGCWNAIRHPIDFRKTVETLAPRAGDDFIDLGPSGTLAAFVKYNVEGPDGPRIWNTINPFDRSVRNLQAIEEGRRG